MKILFISNYFKGPGFNRGAWHVVADNMRTAGHDIITTSSKVNRAVRLLDMLMTIWTRRSKYQIAQIDVFSGRAFLFAESCSIALSALRKPFILTLHGGNLPQFAQKHAGRVSRLLNAAALVIAPSRYLQDEMEPFRQDIILIPNPMDIERYVFFLRNNPHPKLIWLRAFHQIYNPGLAPHVLASLKQVHPNVHLTMIGPDKGDGSLQSTQQLAQKLGLASQIQFPGGVPKADVPSWLNRGDIFINTTNVDNTPVSVMEAMACGLCVVSTNVGGIPYLVSDEVDGLLVPPNDPEAMAAAVRRILNEPGLAARLSMNARKKAEQFDWSVILPQWERLFEELT